MRKPELIRLTNLPNYINAHRAADAYVRHHSTTLRGAGWSAYGGKIDDHVLDDIAERSSVSLIATNATARIEFAKATRRCLQRAVPASSKSPAFFVTLAPSQFAMSGADAKEFDWSEMEEWAARALSGFDYIGQVDVAPFLNSPEGRRKFISWHLHLIVWSTSEARLSYALDRVEATHHSFLPGRSVTHIKRLCSQESLGSRALYMMKAPLRSYRCYPTIPQIPSTMATWKVKKDTHRIGQAVEIASILHGATIPTLCVAGGTGKGMLRKIIRRAQDRVEKRERLRLRHMLMAINGKTAVAYRNPHDSGG